MNITICQKRYRFTYKWWFAVLTLLFVVAFVALGRWQLARYDQKMRWQHILDTQTQVLHWQQLPMLMRNKHRLQYRHLSVTGQFIQARQMLLDNRIMHGHVGYEVITPFLPRGERRAILVNRGWIAAPRSRQQLPPLPLFSPVTTVTGTVKFSEATPFTLGPVQAEGKTWPKRIEAMDIMFLQQLTGYPLQGFVLQLASEETNGFVREWRIGGLPPMRHLGYAVQWFAMAAAWLVIFVVLSFKRIKEYEDKVDGQS